MFIERLITFIVLGFFVFVADLGGWWHAGSLSDWYSNYILWLALIILSYFAAARHNSGDS